jgi:SAM-dependent methyltransferase/uncharacterized protein YbaR (Trm112 family)
MTHIDPWFLRNLRCPGDGKPVVAEGNALVCPDGHRYPVVEGVPVMLRRDVEQTIPLAQASLSRAEDPGTADPRAPELYLESLGISEAEKQGIADLAARGDAAVDPVVSFLVGATSGYMYEDLIGRLRTYPVPELRLADGGGRRFLDLGCSWGRWCIAGAREGYDVVGVDPSLGAVMAARRVAEQLRASARYLVADARYLPFPDASFEQVFSYSVLQHLSKQHVMLVMAQVARVLVPNGHSLIQMASAYGVRSLYHQLRRGFRKPRDFDVRYWRPGELLQAFNRLIGPSELSADCYFGLGLQAADRLAMPRSKRLMLSGSELLRGVSTHFGVVRQFADSLYVHSRRTNTHG